MCDIRATDPGCGPPPLRHPRLVVEADDIVLTVEQAAGGRHRGVVIE